MLRSRYKASGPYKDSPRPGAHDTPLCFAEGERRKAMQGLVFARPG